MLYATQEPPPSCSLPPPAAGGLDAGLQPTAYNQPINQPPIPINTAPPPPFTSACAPLTPSRVRSSECLCYQIHDSSYRLPALFASAFRFHLSRTLSLFIILSFSSLFSSLFCFHLTLTLFVTGDSPVLSSSHPVLYCPVIYRLAFLFTLFILHIHIALHCLSSVFHSHSILYSRHTLMDFTQCIAHSPFPSTLHISFFIHGLYYHHYHQLARTDCTAYTYIHI